MTPETTMIGQILGPFLVIACLAILANYKSFKKIVEELTHSHASVFMISMFRLLVGLIIVVFHNVRTPTSAFLVTFVGWFAIAVGAMGMFLPDQVVKALPVKNPWLIKTALVVCLVLGLGLMYVGFVA